jgi:hypothetical protein
MIHWPERIVYGGTSFPISFVDPRDLEDGNFGECGTVDGEIQVLISKDLRGDFRDLVVCHEIIHAWLRLSGLDISDEVQEELLCDTFGHALLQTLRIMLRPNEEPLIHPLDLTDGPNRSIVFMGVDDDES